MPARKDPLRVVLTASRRTDLVRWYPGAIVQALAARYPPRKVHSIVLVTKFPAAILDAPLRDALRPYGQCTAQVTITGWGGTVLEPKVPAPAEALQAIPDLLDFLGDPRRLRVRLDPLLRLADGRDNLEQACSIMSTAASMGVKSFITSIVTPYAKIAPRLNQRGLALAPWNEAEQAAAIGGLADAAASLGVSLAGCCLPGLPNAACIDGRSLQESHPEQLPCRLDHPSGQRKLCGCSHAIDLGWYSSHPCPSGCLYCYANPVADG